MSPQRADQVGIVNGVPRGGTAGQVLTKGSDGDFDHAWADASGAAPIAPLDIDGCVLLLDANDLELDEGDAIMLWANTGEGGSDYDATADEEDEAPIYQTDEATGLPVAHFPNVADAGDTIAITAVDQGAKSFSFIGLSGLANDLTGVLVAGQKITVTDSTGNDGEYTFVSYSYTNDPLDPTSTVVVAEAIPDATVDGDLSFPAHYLSITGAGLDLFQNVEALTIAGISSYDLARSGTLLWCSDGDGGGLIRASLFDTQISAANTEAADGSIGAGDRDNPHYVDRPLLGVVGSVQFTGLRPQPMIQQLGRQPVWDADVSHSYGPGPTADTPSDNICIGATTIDHYGRQGPINLVCAWRRFLTDDEREGLLAYFAQRLS